MKGLGWVCPRPLSGVTTAGFLQEPGHHYCDIVMVGGNDTDS